MGNPSYSGELGATRLDERSEDASGVVDSPLRGGLEILSILRDRRFWRGSGVWVVLMLILVNPVVVAWHEARQRRLGEEAAAQGQMAEDPTQSNRPVRYDWSIGDKFERFLPYIPDSRNTNLVIISGMSQMYTMNDYRPGDQTIAEWMDDALAPKGTRVFGLAAPNLSQQEALFLLLTTLSKPETKPDVFIFAVAFRQLRELEVRKQFLGYMRKHPELTGEWRVTAERYRAKYPLASANMLETLETLERNDAAVSDTSFESRLRNRVSDYVPIVRERKSLNSELRLVLFSIRNTLLGIKATSKRPIIRQRYDVNREFLALLADVARENDVRLLLYVVPFNPLAENPFIPEEYASFKQWLNEFGEENQVPVANLENAVPSEDWGLFLGGPDFGHFRGAGHRKTASALLEVFSPHLTPQSSTPGAPRS